MPCLALSADGHWKRETLAGSSTQVMSALGGIGVLGLGADGRKYSDDDLEKQPAGGLVNPARAVDANRALGG